MSDFIIKFIDEFNSYDLNYRVSVSLFSCFEQAMMQTDNAETRIVDDVDL